MQFSVDTDLSSLHNYIIYSSACDADKTHVHTAGCSCWGASLPRRANYILTNNESDGATVLPRLYVQSPSRN